MNLLLYIRPLYGIVFQKQGVDSQQGGQFLMFQLASSQPAGKPLAGDAAGQRLLTVVYIVLTIAITPARSPCT